MRTIALRKIVVAVALIATTALAGCGDDDTGAGTGGSGAMDAGGSGGTSGSGGTGGDDMDGGAGTAGTGGSGGSGGAPCDPSTHEVNVDADITADTHWTCGTYLLQQIVNVTGDHTLTIDPGVIVLGDVDQSTVTTALIVTRGSKLDARGTAEEPIVFSSSAALGSRTPGDWGGVVLLGNARINDGACIGGSGACDQNGAYFQSNIEGLDPTDPNSQYGGTDDAWDCGTIRYARIEFAGYELAPMKELNGLSVGACGTGTELSHIQVLRGSDDGIEMFGGTAGLDHIVITGASDDGLDWDLGWRGKVQFLVIHQLGNDGDKGIEADNLGANEDALPRSKPEIYNATMVGNPTKTGMLLREGTHGVLRNFLVQDFATVVNLHAAQVMLTNEWPSNLSIESSCFFSNPVVGSADSTDDDMGFNEDDAIRDAARNNVFTVDPMLGSTNVEGPNYIPASTMLGGKATPPTGFDATATYCGAFAQGGTDWTMGWTSFIAD